MPRRLATSLTAIAMAMTPLWHAAAQAPHDTGALVEATCSGCHGLNLIENSLGYDHDGWKALIATMIDLSGTDELDVISAYLAERYPPNDRRAPLAVDGPMDLAFTEYAGTTLGTRARDPVEAPDGAIWWSGHWADLLVRADPETGDITEYPLPAGARPHTVTAGPDGALWYTGNGNATMGRLDPATGAVTEYPMPDPAATDPHSAIVAPGGIVWFTLQRANRVGRLDPASGDIRLVTMPTAASRPYGIKLSSDGKPWVAANGSNRLYEIDAETMAVSEHPLPDAATTVRRLAFDADDTIWYVNSARGRIGHFDPATGTAREWPSPSGEASHPYAIAVIDGIVWYNESGTRPDMLVRFDPAAETFQSWPIPSGTTHGSIYAGIVRHMRPMRDNYAGGVLSAGLPVHPWSAPAGSVGVFRQESEWTPMVNKRLTPPNPDRDSGW
jgi:virginiamycin B lyase